MVLFAVERRKAWRMLQSKAGVVNKDYQAQKALLAKLGGYAVTHFGYEEDCMTKYKCPVAAEMLNSFAYGAEFRGAEVG